MTLENFKYRTNPMFLRNQFATKDSMGIPTIPKPKFDDDSLADLRLFPFNQIVSDCGLHSSRIVHFFLYDYNFEKIWNYPEKFVKLLSKYQGVLTPDFSMYTEMPYALQVYNTFRNRWCGAYMADKGINVIPTISWSDEKSFEFCFKGVEKGSIVAVSTYMFHEHNNHADQKDIFMNGYNKMLEVIEPSKIICYSEPFNEMRGNIIYINYDLSSWKHFDDDANKLFVKSRDSKIASDDEQNKIVHKTGYVAKGGGSALGGKWIPKTESEEHFLGEPNSIKISYKSTKKGSYTIINKYDNNGKAILERHLTDHNRPDKHSNPHDHKVNWDGGYPKLGPPINYPDGTTPEFKIYYIKGEPKMASNYNDLDFSFKTLGEFKWTLYRGSNVNFEYKGVEYGIEGHDDKFDIWIANKGDIANGLSLEDALDFEIDGVKLRDLILDALIIDRQF